MLVCDGCQRVVHEDEGYITERDGEYERGLLYCPECADENDAARYAEYCFRMEQWDRDRLSRRLAEYNED